MIEDLDKKLDSMLYDIAAVYANANTPRKTVAFMYRSIEFLEYLKNNEDIIGEELLNAYSAAARKLTEQMQISRRQLQVHHNVVKRYNIEETLEAAVWKILWRNPSLKQEDKFK